MQISYLQPHLLSPDAGLWGRGDYFVEIRQQTIGADDISEARMTWAQRPEQRENDASTGASSICTTHELCRGPAFCSPLLS